MITSELTDVVRAAREAKDKERDAIRNFTRDVVKEHGLLDKDEFWNELDRFVGIVKQFRDVYKRTNWSKQAAHEFFRAAMNKDADIEDSLIVCLRFVTTYDVKVSKIRKAFDRLEEEGLCEFGMGDDGFGDMCDSFLLHGREAYVALIEDNVVPKKPDLGENYIVFNLDKAAEEWVRNCVVELSKED